MAGPNTVFLMVLMNWLLFQQALGQQCDNEAIPELPNWEFRYVFHKIDPSDTPLHDAYLTAGWYRTYDPMPELPPDTINRCGTRFPIWLNGSNPDTDMPVTREACLLTLNSQCDTVFNIQVAKCPDSYLYYLVPTQSSSNGYCIGDRPTYTAPRPSISADTEEVEPGPQYKTIISCDFVPSANPDMLYMVHWFRDGDLHYNTPVAQYADSDQFLIREGDFVSGRFYMGNTLSCAVTAFEIENGPAGKRSDTSDDFFVGIKILTPSLTFAAGDDESKRTIRLQPTVPVGCLLEDGSCRIRLYTYLPERPIKEECQGLGFESGQSKCETEINASRYSDVLNILVAPNDPGQTRLEGDDHYEVYIKVERTKDNDLWPDYLLPSIPVTIASTGDGSNVPGVCSAVNDPHFTTFDGRKFDDHSEETKILYRNTAYHTEVQIASRPCGSIVRCVCGIAVRAGFDVYVINVCDTFEDGYRFCHDNSRSLTVRKISYTQTKIELPYGTYVVVHRSGGYLRAYIYPSSLDKENTVGLCGTLDQNINNDFHRRDGTPMSQDYHQENPSTWNPRHTPDVFLNEWRVQSDAEDLFSDDFDTANLRPSSEKICVCESDLGQATATVPCKANGAAVCKVVQGGTFKQAKHCKSIAVTGRRRRSKTRRSFTTVPVDSIHNMLTEHTRAKRAEPDTHGWTEQDAEQFCTTTFQGQQTYNLCDQIPSVDTQSSIDVCSTDITITNGTDWVADSVDGMVSGCNEEMVRNLTLVRAAAAGDPLQDEIKAVSCPNNCSGNGVCDNGACICDEGAGASDCSVDLTKAVHVSSLLDGGLCDLALQQCDSVSVFGGAFVDGEDLLCQLQEFTTFIEVECPISGTRKRRAADDVTGDNSAFVTGYSVAVTNNAELYSERKDLFVYDSQCQTFQEVGDNITFSLIDGHCFIDNMCVTEGQVSVEDECHVCQPQAATRSWSRDDSKDGCEPLVGPVEDAGSGGLDTVPIIVGAVVGGVVVAIIVAVIIGVAIVKSNRSKVVVGSSDTWNKP